MPVIGILRSSSVGFLVIAQVDPHVRAAGLRTGAPPLRLVVVQDRPGVDALPGGFVPDRRYHLLLESARSTTRAVTRSNPEPRDNPRVERELPGTRRVVEGVQEDLDDALVPERRLRA